MYKGVFKCIDGEIANSLLMTKKFREFAPDALKKRVNFKIFQGWMPPDPPTLRCALHVDRELCPSPQSYIQSSLR